jgi:diguanylate cyclase (GGDEF)-like protein/PAS domain S-box-containing protein
MSRPQGRPGGGDIGESAGRDASRPPARAAAEDPGTEHIGSRILLQLEHEVALCLANAESLRTAIKSVIRTVCGTLGWDCGRLLRVDEAAGVLRFYEHWSVEGADIARFIERSRQVVHAPGKGLSGHVWQSGEPVWVTDLTRDPRVQFGLALDTVMRGAFHFPVTAQGKVIGVLSFNSREVRPPDEALLQAIRVIGSLVGQYLKRADTEEILRGSEERFRRLTEMSSDWYWEQDENFRFTVVSENLARRTKRPPYLVYGKTRWDLPTLNMTTEDWLRHRAVIERHEPFRNLELHRLDADGNDMYFSVSGEPIFDGEGRFRGYRGVGVDITERKHAEEALRHSEVRYRSVVDHLAEGVFIIDPRRHIISCNASAERILGIHKEALLGKSLSEANFKLIREDGMPFPEEERPALRTLRTGEPQSGVVMGVERPDGSVIWLSMSTRTLPGPNDGAPSGVVMSFNDITERRSFEEKLTYLAQYDLLTGLPNRALLLDRLEQALIRARRQNALVGILLIDLDRFKEINDSMGHSAGDAVLKEVAKRVRAALRDTDSVARLGGDEFCIIIEGAESRSHVSVAAAKLRRLFEEPVMTAENKEIFIELSIGSAVYPEDGETMEDLLKNADIAMYEAKRDGGHAFRFYSSALRAKTADEINLVSMLRRAVDRNELVLYYQPQVDIPTGRPVGVEALVRWEHPEHGLVSPYRFVRLAEETGLIVPIGEWVLKTACAEAKAWQLAGMPEMKVSVNLSARQFRDSQLIRKIAAVLAATGLPPRLLELEITESVIMSHTDHTIGVLQRLTELGVRVSVDDFGTGYSSLAYLKRFPVHKLKIDHAFVRDIPGNKEDAAIVQAIITLARTLQLRVIAEGVENSDQLKYLASLGCHEYQGFVYSRPLPARELIDLVRRQFVGMF